MINYIQIFGRILYRSIVITLLFLLIDNTAHYGLWIGIIIGCLSELKSLSK